MLELYLWTALLVDLVLSTPQAAASGPRRSPEALTLPARLSNLKSGVTACLGQWHLPLD
ncbi:hypothetical protein BJX68DRAFT_223957 [Aspergillus pseudodeflectus]|uniref:Uncharacterized protein n=1 Tax=Aspergillus pseudodeflectus TaxID=176178 RepID=A0ABR4LC47_9EURO